MQPRIFRKTSLLLSGVLCLAAGAAGQDITPAERRQALRYLAQTREGVVRAVNGLSEAQWKFKPASDRWSAAEVLEHIAVTEEIVLKNVLGRLSEAPPPPPGFDPQRVDAAILAEVPDRSTKYKAPAMMVPTGRWTPSEALDHFLAACGELASLLESNHDLRGHVVPHPVLGTLDGYEWILVVAAHNERHTKQILEVEADPHFPSSPQPRNTN